MTTYEGIEIKQLPYVKSDEKKWRQSRRGHGTISPKDSLTYNRKALYNSHEREYRPFIELETTHIVQSLKLISEKNSKTEIAEKSGVTYQTILEIMSGKRRQIRQKTYVQLVEFINKNSI